jgi:hypothetical protein
MPKLNVHVTLDATEEEETRYGWVTRLFLSIPEEWLERWGLQINAVVAVFCVAYALFALFLTLSGWFRRFGLTPEQAMAATLGWLPFLLLAQVIPYARLAHMLVGLDAQRARMRCWDQDMAGAIAEAVQQGIHAAEEEHRAGVKGPTLQ